ncbi:MAG: hypothetical protein RIQ33_2487 [Bacteroidota bacterium]|jgi:hypothetical protein
MKEVLIEGIDFTYNENGYMVFTAHHLAKRGYCCDSGCKNCPYKKKQIPQKRKLWEDNPPETTD